MNLLQIGIRGPISDSESGTICTIDMRREREDGSVSQTSTMVKTESIAEAFKSAVKLVVIKQLDQ